MRRLGDHGRIGRKNGREVFGEDERRARHHRTDGAHDAGGGPARAFGTIGIIGPHALPHDRRHGRTHAHRHHVHHALDTKAQPKCRQGGRAELRSDACEQHVDRAERDACERGRGAHSRDTRNDIPTRLRPAEHAAPLQNDHADNAAESTRYERGERGAANTERGHGPQAANEDRVEHEPEHGGDHQDIQRRARVALRTERSIDGEEAEDERHTEQIGAEVVAANGTHAGAGVHHGKQPVQQKRRGQRDGAAQE